MKVLFTGSRDLTDGSQIMRLIDELPAGSTVVVGDCRFGADLFVSSYCKDQRKDIRLREYKANWEMFGLKAGPMRNQRMIDEEGPFDAIHAFPTESSRGTWDCVRRARGKGPILIWKRNSKRWHSTEYK